MSGKKKILLTTSAAPSQSPFSTTEKRPPIGIGFLISILRDAGHEVFFIDNYLQPSDFLETDYLTRNEIDFVGIYANTICYRDTLRMFYRLEYLRQSGKWQGRIMVGGPHTTVALETIPDFVDFVVQGEGEQAVLDIVEDKVKDRVVCYPALKELDALPMPAWDYFIHLPYKWTVDWFSEAPVFTMNTSRGCPFRCAFCSVGSIWGKQYTYFSADRIVSDIEYLIGQYNAKGIYFREDNFTLNKDRLRRFCNLLIEKGISISWSCESRVNTLDRETVELMHRAGLRAFYFGVESGSQRILDFMKKDITIEQTRNAFRLCHEFGIRTAASIVVGVPTETEEDIEQTRKLLEEIRPTVTWYNVFTGIPDSELYRYAIENKLYEFIDDRKLVYLKGHNERVKRFYGKQWNADIPVCISRPSISVVMSVYNGGKYLEQAIKSVLAQTYQDFEFIIVDDASTDDFSSVLSKFDDPRIKLITNSENLGLTKSLNKAVSVARGRYIARMDADDISLPLRFERQVAFLEKTPQYALVGSSYYQIDENGKIKSIVKVLTDDQSLREGLMLQNWFGHGSVMMSKEVLLKAGGYNERFRFSQDYDLWLRIAENNKIANIEEPLYGWRASCSGISIEKRKEQRHYAQMAVEEAKNRLKSADSEKRTGPMVSVIVPTYNRPDTLIEALNSILCQTYRDFEIIVVNDAGSDVENIISYLNRDRNITYIRHGKNMGLGAARNSGIKTARGKYLAYLDDDDLYYPEHIETLVEFLEKGDYKVAYTDAHRAYQINKNSKYHVVKRDLPYSCDFDRDRIRRENFVPVLCFMHDRMLLNEVGLFDESLRKLEDWDMWIRMSEKHGFAHIKKVTCEFAWRNDGSTMTSGQGQEFVEARQKIAAKQGLRSGKETCTKVVPEQPDTKKGMVSIIILTFNQLRYTKECVESIIKHTPESYEIIFVDNGSTDGTLKWLGQLAGEGINCRMIENRKNLGFAKGCNQGIEAAQGEFIVLLNNDAVVTENWLSGMLETLNSSSETGIVGSMTNNISGIQKVRDAAYETLEEMHSFAAEFYEKHRHRRVLLRRIVGFCMLFRRALVSEIGLLDENFGTGNFEDDDYCLRAELAGYVNMMAGDVFIHHYGSRSFVGNKIDYKAAMGGNRKLFLKKWSSANMAKAQRERYIIFQLLDNAQRHIRRDELKDVIPMLVTAIRQLPHHKRTYIVLSKALIDQKQFQSALDILQKMPGVESDVVALALIGYCHEGLKAFEEAEKYAAKVLSICANAPEAINLQGVIAYQKDDPVSAQRLFESAIRADPGYGEPYANLGVLAWSAGDQEKGLSLLEKGFMLSPDVTDHAVLYHSAAVQIEQYHRAELCFAEALILYPESKRSLFLYIDLLLKQEKYEKAMDLIEEALVKFGAGDDMLAAALAVRGKIGEKKIAEEPGQGATLSLCMIVRNEEKHLAACLNSVKTIADEIIIVDTGSVDRTKDLAFVYGATVFDYEWKDDFSDARNFSLSKAHGDWVLVLDGDEKLAFTDLHKIRRLVTKKKKDLCAYVLITRNYISGVFCGWVPNEGEYAQEEAGGGWFPSDKIRLFPNDRRVRFENPVHELVEASVKQIGMKIKECSVPVHHYGKLDPDKAGLKGSTYRLLGMKKLGDREDDIKALYELAVQTTGLGQYEEALDLWQRFIQLKPDYVNAYLDMTKAYAELGRIEEAVDAARKALKLRPDMKEAVFNFAYSQFRSGNFSETEGILERFSAKDPDYPMTEALLSLVSMINGKTQRAGDIIMKLKKKGFDYAAYLYAQAKGLESDNRRREAKMILSAAMGNDIVTMNILELVAQLNRD